MYNQPPPQYQPQYQPPPAPAAQPMEVQPVTAYPRAPAQEYVGGGYHHKPPYPGIVGNTILTVFVVLSVLLLFLGAMMVHYAPLITNKKYSGDDAADEMASDMRTQKTTDGLGKIMVDVGSFLLIFMLLLAGMFRSDWSDYVRFGVLFFAAVFSFAIGFRI